MVPFYNNLSPGNAPDIPFTDLYILNNEKHKKALEVLRNNPSSIHLAAYTQGGTLREGEYFNCLGEISSDRVSRSDSTEYHNL